MANNREISQFASFLTVDESANNNVGIATTVRIAAGGLYVDGVEVIGPGGAWKGPNSGLVGAQGAQGAPGAQGAQGSAGAQGAQGAQGYQGAAGSATITNNADNRVITGGSGTNLNGEANLTFDGSRLLINGGGVSADWGPFNVNIDGSNIMHLGYGTNDDNYFTAGGSGIQVFRTGGTERFRIGSSGQIGLSGANYGTSGQVLTSQGSGSAAQWATLSTDAQSVAILTDVKTQGTRGGTFTSGAWQVRDLNTEAYDPDGIVTLSSNQFTLVSGTYYVWWSAPGYSVTRHQSRLWNVNGNNQEELGDSVYTPTSVQVHSQGAAIISNGTYRIEHRCQTTQSNNGFGVEANFTTERYTRVVIIKIG